MGTTWKSSAGRNVPGPSWTSAVSDAMSLNYAMLQSPSLANMTSAQAKSQLEKFIGQIPQSIPVDPNVRISVYPTVSTISKTDPQPFPEANTTDIGNISEKTTQMQMWNLANPNYQSGLVNAANTYGPGASTPSIINSPTTFISGMMSSQITPPTVQIPHANYQTSWHNARQNVFQKPGPGNKCVNYIQDQNTSGNATFYAAPPIDQCVCRVQNYAKLNDISTGIIPQSQALGMCQGSTWSNGGPPIEDLYMPQATGSSDPTKAYESVPVDITTYNDDTTLPPAMTKGGCDTFVSLLNGVKVQGCPSGVCYKVVNGVCTPSNDPDCEANGGSCSICDCCTANGITTSTQCMACSDGNESGTIDIIVPIVGLVVVIIIGVLLYRHFKGKK